MANKWKGEAAKIRRRVLGAIDARMKKRVGESDLGRLWSGDSPLMSRGWVNASGYAARARENAAHNQAVLYAVALGVSLDDAQARIAAQLATVGDTFQPGKGYVKGA
jgi:hypothetical protein